MPDNSMARTRVFKPKTEVHDDPQSLLIMELGQHIGEMLAGDKSDKAASDSDMEVTIRKAGRAYVLRWVIAIATVVGGGGAGLYRFGGPAEQAQKAEAVTAKAEEKMDELDATTKELEALKSEMEDDRRARLNGRLSGVENRVAANSGELAGIRVGQDALLDATLTEKAAKAAKADAKTQAVKVEKAAKASLTADAKAE